MNREVNENFQNSALLKALMPKNKSDDFEYKFKLEKEIVICGDCPCSSYISSDYFRCNLNGNLKVKYSQLRPKVCPLINNI